MVNGGDPQLDAAIKLMMDQVKDKPWKPMQRPPGRATPREPLGWRAMNA